MKYRIRRADGAYRWIDGRAEPLRDESGAIVQWYSVSFDIDDQVHAQEALRERERALSQLVETLPAMIDCAAPDGEPIYRSQQLREFLGYDLEELDGSGKSRLDGTLDAGVHPDDLAGVKEKYAHSLATGEPYARRHRSAALRWRISLGRDARRADADRRRKDCAMERHLPGCRWRGSGAGRAAVGAREACPRKPGRKPGRAVGFDRA